MKRYVIKENAVLDRKTGEKYRIRHAGRIDVFFKGPDGIVRRSDIPLTELKVEGFICPVRWLSGATTFVKCWDGVLI